MEDLIREYKKSLRLLRTAKVKPLFSGSMLSDTQWAIEYMETGQVPGTKWTVTRWSREDREVLFDPNVLEKCFTLPQVAPETSEGVRRMLEHLMSCLSEREREAFVLVHGQGFSHSQAAEYMGLSKGNIYTLLKRAEKKFSGYRSFVRRMQAKSEGVC